ncbi:MAG: hypothetical protein WC806_00130 [Candidatus Gracilibacteria bacterium]|jgi:hypothetical protein
MELQNEYSNPIIGTPEEILAFNEFSQLISSTKNSETAAEQYFNKLGFKKGDKITVGLYLDSGKIIGFKAEAYSTSSYYPVAIVEFDESYIGKKINTCCLGDCH